MRQKTLTIRFRGHSELPILSGFVALIADSMHGGMLDSAIRRIDEIARANKSEMVTFDEDGNEIPLSR